MPKCVCGYQWGESSRCPECGDLVSHDTQKLEQQITSLKNELIKMTRERDEAVYKKEIAEWAVVGVVTSRVQVQMTQVLIANDALRLAEIIGKQAAVSLLHESQIAFDAHADMYELRQHVYYLENHAKASGLAFTPWKETDKTQETFKYTRWAAWPVQKSFSVHTHPAP